MGVFDFLNPAKKYEDKLAGQSDFFGNMSQETLNRGLPMLWNTATSSGLTPGQSAVKSGYDADLLAGFQRSLAEIMRGNEDYGVGRSLANEDARRRAGADYSRERARNTGNLLQLSEQQRQQILQWLMQMGTGAGGQAAQGWQQAGSMASANNPFMQLLSMAPGIGGMFAPSGSGTS